VANCQGASSGRNGTKAVPYKRRTSGSWGNRSMASSKNSRFSASRPSSSSCSARSTVSDRVRSAGPVTAVSGGRARRPAADPRSSIPPCRPVWVTALADSLLLDSLRRPGHGLAGHHLSFLRRGIAGGSPLHRTEPGFQVLRQTRPGSPADKSASRAPSPSAVASSSITSHDRAVTATDASSTFSSPSRRAEQRAGSTCSKWL